MKTPLEKLEKQREWKRNWYKKNREHHNEYQRIKQREYAAKRKAEKIALAAENKLLRDLLEKQLKGEQA